MWGLDWLQSPAHTGFKAPRAALDCCLPGPPGLHSQVAPRGTALSYRLSRAGSNFLWILPMMQKGIIPEVFRAPLGIYQWLWLVLSLCPPDRKPLSDSFSFVAARVSGIDGYLKVTSNQHGFKHADLVRLLGFKFSLFLLKSSLYLLKLLQYLLTGLFWRLSEVINAKCLTFTRWVLDEGGKNGNWWLQSKILFVWCFTVCGLII